MIHHVIGRSVFDEYWLGDFTISSRRLMTVIISYFVRLPREVCRLGMPSLHSLAERGEVRKLREAIACLDSRDCEEWDETGTTPLHLACTEGHLAVVQMLIDVRANVDSLDCGGWTPLHNAIVEGNGDVVNILLDAGADMTIKADIGEESMCNALQMAEAQGEHDIALRLREENLLRRQNARGLNRSRASRRIPVIFAWTCFSFIVAIHLMFAWRLYFTPG